MTEKAEGVGIAQQFVTAFLEALPEQYNKNPGSVNADLAMAFGVALQRVALGGIVRIAPPRIDQSEPNEAHSV